MLSVGSLFSGIGGIELGLERAGGFQTAWFVEWDLHAQAVLKKRFTNVPVYGDIQEIDWKSMPSVDILTGGFPCQDASVANSKGDGIKGARTGLWKHYLEAIRQLRPKYVVAENVPNLLNRGFEEVIEDLAAVGYTAEWDIVRYEIVVRGRYVMPRTRLVTIAYPDSECGEGVSSDYAKDANHEFAALARDLLEARTDELPEPPLLGVGVRLSYRLDRTRRTGNAVSPKMSEAIARAIKEAER